MPNIPPFLSLSGPLGIVLAVVGVLLVLVILWTACCKIVPTDKVLVITGLGGKRFVTGKMAFVIPFLNRCDYLKLGVVQCQLETENEIPTKDAQLIKVSAVANFQIGVKSYELDVTDPVTGETVKQTVNPQEIAARNYLNKNEDDMRRDVSEVLLGKMREAVGKTDLKILMSERDEFSDTVYQAALGDMRQLGLELITFNVQDFSDNKGVIEAMGADMAEQIKRDAQLAQIEAEQQVAVRQNELDLKKAELQTTADTARAAAEMVFDTQTAKAAQALKAEQVNAEIAAETRRIELAERKVDVTEREAQAKVKMAEAEKQARAEQAEAAKIETSRRAEAELYAAQQAAEATRAKAAADADATRLTGEADGAAEKARGEGIAAGIKAQGDAYNEMDNPLILVQSLIDKYPEIMAAASKPLENVDSITMYGEGNETKLVGDTTKTISQVTAAIKDSTGIDIAQLLSAAVAGKVAGEAAKPEPAPAESDVDTDVPEDAE